MDIKHLFVHFIILAIGFSCGVWLFNHTPVPWVGVAVMVGYPLYLLFNATKNGR